MIAKTVKKRPPNHFARLENSPRLQRLLEYLRQAGFTGATTREIIKGADICAVNSAAKELRLNGFDVRCTPERTKGRTLYRYTIQEHAE